MKKIKLLYLLHKFEFKINYRLKKLIIYFLKKNYSILTNISKLKLI